MWTAKNDKQQLIETTVSLAKEVDDDDKQGFIIAGILSATDKFIDKNYSNKLKEWLKMTKVGRLFEEEKIEYANEYAQKYAQEYANEKMLRTARTLLEKNVDILTIMESTGLSKATILKLKDTPVKAQA